MSLPAMQNALPSATELCTKGDKIPGAQVSVTTWDRYGRPVSVTDSVGKVVTTHYDAVGRVTDIINPAGDRIHNIYNINNQIVEKWAYPAGSSKGYLLSSFAYNPAGELLWEAGEDGKKNTLHLHGEWSDCNKNNTLRTYCFLAV